MSKPKIVLRVRKAEKAKTEDRSTQQDEARERPWIQVGSEGDLGLITDPKDEVANRLSEEVLAWSQMRSDYILWLEQFVPEGATFNPDWAEDDNQEK